MRPGNSSSAHQSFKTVEDDLEMAEVTMAYSFMMWGLKRPSHASCLFKLKVWAAYKSPTKSDGNATGWCYAIYCCQLQLIHLMRPSLYPPPPTSPLHFATPCNGHIFSSLSQAGVRGDIQKQLRSVHTRFNLAELESGLLWGPPTKQYHYLSPPPSHSHFAVGPNVDRMHKDKKKMTIIVHKFVDIT